jgi:hypothetical protein
MLAFLFHLQHKLTSSHTVPPQVFLAKTGLDLYQDSAVFNLHIVRRKGPG